MIHSKPEKVGIRVDRSEPWFQVLQEVLKETTIGLSQSSSEGRVVYLVPGYTEKELFLTIFDDEESLLTHLDSRETNSVTYLARIVLPWENHSPLVLILWIDISPKNEYWTMAIMAEERKLMIRALEEDERTELYRELKEAALPIPHPEKIREHFK